MSTGQVIYLMAATNVPCLILGYLFGRLTKATVRIEETMATDEEPVSETPPATRRRITSLQFIGAAVVVIGLVTAGFGVAVVRNQDRLAGCVVGYSNATADALKASRAAQAVVNEQLDNFMRAILEAFSSDPAVGRQKIFDAVEAYSVARAEQLQAQKDNPLPEAPRDACAELIN